MVFSRNFARFSLLKRVYLSVQSRLLNCVLPASKPSIYGEGSEPRENGYMQTYDNCLGLFQFRLKCACVWGKAGAEMGRE